MKENPLFSDFDPAFFQNNHYSTSELEKMIISSQIASMRERASGKYDLILAAVSFFPTLNVSYHFGRMVDDIADGDAPLPGCFSGFEEFVDNLKNRALQPENSDKVKCAAEFLLLRSVDRLNRISKNQQEVLEGVNWFLNSMLEENRRRVDRKVLTKRQLEKVHYNSFGSSLEISLIAIGSNNRAKDIPEAPLILGKDYSIEEKELKPDLKRGICNIPSEVLSTANLTLEHLMKNPDLVSHPKIQEWIINEEIEVGEILDKVKGRKLDTRSDLLVNRFMLLGVRKRHFEKKHLSGRRINV